MITFPQQIRNAQELDELLSRPSAALIDDLRQLDGDILVLGASGKMGPTIARMARRAMDEAGSSRKVYVVARSAMDDLQAAGCEVIQCDLLNLAEVEKLPRVKNVVFLVGRKFGSTGSEEMTWAINTIVPYHVARTFTGARVVALSTGCVYPVVHLSSGGCTEETPTAPVGEYAQSCLGRERVFDYLSSREGLKVVHIRLNYSVEPRYGVLADVASKVWKGEALDITTGYANVIWQGDACDQVLRSLRLASSPATVLNVTGPETFSIRQVAQRFARIFDKEVIFRGEENGYGYLSNATLALSLFGYPTVPLGQIIDWTAAWVSSGGTNLGKPTHFETQDGRY